MTTATPHRPIEPVPTLTFSPLAWLKLQFFCHHGDTEIGGFGISAAKNLLYVEDFCPIKQLASAVSVRFDDDAVGEYFDRCVDQGLHPKRFGRIWLHTHPGASATPSGMDEATFARVFGSCDWAVMFILARTGETYARLAFSAGPGGRMQLPVQVDWTAWPEALSGVEGALARHLQQWHEEFSASIQLLPSILPQRRGAIEEAKALAGDDDTFWLGLGPYSELLVEELFPHDHQT